jgi:hypothetical protein
MLSVEELDELELLDEDDELDELDELELLDEEPLDEELGGVVGLFLEGVGILLGIALLYIL